MRHSKQESICPKCHEPGVEHYTRHHYTTKKKGPVERYYLEYLHKTGDTWKNPKRCNIGRTSDTSEFFEELGNDDRVQLEYLNKNAKLLSQELRVFFEKYSPKTAIPMGVVSDKVLTILEKYNY
jgi:hypothetical protein